MDKIDLLIFVPILGALLIYAGVTGLRHYARIFANDPNSTITRDLFISLLNGPSFAPAVLCVISILAGIWFTAVAILLIGIFGFISITELL